MSHQSEFSESVFLVAVLSSDLKKPQALVSLGTDGAVSAQLLRVRGVFVVRDRTVLTDELRAALAKCKTPGGWEEVLASLGIERLDA